MQFFLRGQGTGSLPGGLPLSRLQDRLRRRQVADREHKVGGMANEPFARPAGSPGPQPPFERVFDGTSELPFFPLLPTGPQL